MFSFIPSPTSFLVKRKSTLFYATAILFVAVGIRIYNIDSYIHARLKQDYTPDLTGKHIEQGQMWIFHPLSDKKFLKTLTKEERAAWTAPDWVANIESETRERKRFNLPTPGKDEMNVYLIADFHVIDAFVGRKELRSCYAYVSFHDPHYDCFKKLIKKDGTVVYWKGEVSYEFNPGDIYDE